MAIATWFVTGVAGGLAGAGVFAAAHNLPLALLAGVLVLAALVRRLD